MACDPQILYYATISWKGGIVSFLPKIFEERKCSLHSDGREALPVRREEIFFLCSSLRDALCVRREGNMLYAYLFERSYAFEERAMQ